MYQLQNLKDIHNFRRQKHYSTSCCIGMYQLQNLKDIHNQNEQKGMGAMLYRNVSIAKFEGYTQRSHLLTEM